MGLWWWWWVVDWFLMLCGGLGVPDGGSGGGLWGWCFLNLSLSIVSLDFFVRGFVGLLNFVSFHV